MIELLASSALLRPDGILDEAPLAPDNVLLKVRDDVLPLDGMVEQAAELAVGAGGFDGVVDGCRIAAE